MGNTQGAPSEKAGHPDHLSPPSLSPTPRPDGEAFDFSSKKMLVDQGSVDEGDGQLILQMGSDKGGTTPGGKDDMGPMRPRASTISPGATLHKSALPTVFRWEGGGTKVYVSGSFYNWQHRVPLIKSHGDFSTIIELPEGEHQYKFFVDGDWAHDPKQPTVSSPSGTLNNVVNVKKTDFEVFEALAMDSMVTHPTTGENQRTHHFSGGHSPPGSYSQVIPERKSAERHAGPPMLPPHLLEVILNKDTNVRCDPALLPEPPSVMLNHLYALSIKDGVMVLSATHRHKKKYVTTLLYKPI